MSIADIDDDEPQSCMPKMASFLRLRKQEAAQIEAIADRYDRETGERLGKGNVTQLRPSVPEAKLPRKALAYVMAHDIEPELDEGGSLVAGLLDVGAMSVVFGNSNVGKTFWCLDLALHVAMGWEWRERPLSAGVVVYVVAEGGRGIRNRVAAWRQHHGIAPEQAIPCAVVASRVDLLDAAADTAPLLALIRDAAAEMGQPVLLIVIDTLSRAIAGGDENSSKDMGAFVRNVDRIREETGAHVQVVHHSGKDTTKGARGHSLLRAACDTEIELVERPGEKSSIATVRKQRDMAGGEVFPFALVTVPLGANTHGREIASAIVEHLDEPTPQHGGEVADAILASSRHEAALGKARAVLDATGASTGPPATEADPPEGVFAAKVTVWRAAALEGVPDDRRNAIRRQFDRNLADLTSDGRVLTAGERQDRVYWLPTPDSS